MTKIFISYRRSDMPYAARGVNDALCKQFGKSNVYFDLEAIQAGLDYRKQIDDMVAKCDVMLVVIGDDWFQLDESGSSRLEATGDLVSLEVSIALKRDIPVIPVLVGEATIPEKDSLPESLHSLVYRQAVEVRASVNFNAQIENLVNNIKHDKSTSSPTSLASIDRAKLRFGLSLGWQLARFEFVDGSPFPEAQAVAPTIKSNIADLLSTDGFPNPVSELGYRELIGTVLTYYGTTDIEKHSTILVGVAAFRTSLVGASKDETSNLAMKQLALSVYRQH